MQPAVSHLITCRNQTAVSILLWSFWSFQDENFSLSGICMCVMIFYVAKYIMYACMHCMAYLLLSLEVTIYDRCQVVPIVLCFLCRLVLWSSSLHVHSFRLTHPVSSYLCGRVLCVCATYGLSTVCLGLPFIHSSHSGNICAIRNSHWVILVRRATNTCSLLCSHTYPLLCPNSSMYGVCMPTCVSPHSTMSRTGHRAYL